MRFQAKYTILHRTARFTLVIFAVEIEEDNSFIFFGFPSTNGLNFSLFFYVLLVGTLTVFPFGSIAAIGAIDTIGSSLSLLARI